MKVGRSWRINLWITCKKPDPNRSIFIDFGTTSKFDEKWDFWTSMRKYAWVWQIVRSLLTPHWCKFDQKNAPKSMKNIRFICNLCSELLTLCVILLEITTGSSTHEWGPQIILIFFVPGGNLPCYHTTLVPRSPDSPIARYPFQRTVIAKYPGNLG